ncbi:MAG: glycosyltransferase family 39 protein [Bacteroidota bacterium]
MDQDLKGKLDFTLPNRVFITLVVMILGVRFLHFGELIDNPHAWRQCDTANYIFDFFKNGIDIFEPAVCWMGAHKTVILEFPLPEAMVAVFYHVFGEHHWVARMFFLLCFCGAAYYFFLIILELFGKTRARVATLIYLSLPLSMFYSRAIHIDFFAVFMAHGMFFHWMKAVKNQEAKHWIAGGLFTTLAFLVKAPYAFFLALPLLMMAIQEKQFVKSLKWTFLLMLPIILFVLWRSYATGVNSLAPDWHYLEAYRKFDENTFWFFGTLEQRLSLWNWLRLGERLAFDVVGHAGVLFVIIGFFQMWWLKQYPFLLAWMLGLLVYLCTFFNLNLVHDYYQIPFLPIASTLITIGIFSLSGNAMVVRMNISRFAFFGGLGIVILGNITNAELRYYKTEDQRVLQEIGEIIEGTTPTSALPVITYNDFDVRNPQILYRARRNGWSVPLRNWNAEAINLLTENEGATHFVFVGPGPPDGAIGKFTRRLNLINSTKLNNTYLKVFIWTLSYQDEIEN